MTIFDYSRLKYHSEAQSQAISWWNRVAGRWVRNLLQRILNEPMPNAPAARKLWAAMISSAVLVLALHSCHLVLVSRELGCRWNFTECRESAVLLTPDSGSYKIVAGEILTEGIWKASYIRRSPGYPLILALSIHLFGSVGPVLWIVPWVAAFAAASLVWLAARLTGKVAVGLGAGFLFCVWPTSYQFEPLVLTDAVHALLFPVALALTMAWIWRERPAVVALAVFTWSTMQLIRPTFAIIVLVWPLVLLKANTSWRYRLFSIAAAASLVVVPALIIISNATKSGIATLSEVGPETFAAYAVPRLQEDLGMGKFKTLRERAFKQYRGLELNERIVAEKEDTRRWIMSHPIVAVRSFARGIAGQVLWPPRPWFADRLEVLFPSWTAFPRPVMPVFWVLTCIGLVCVGRSRPRTGLVIALMFPLVMIPASVSHFVEGRLRLPLDFLALALIAVALGSGVDALRLCFRSAPAIKAD